MDKPAGLVTLDPGSETQVQSAVGGYDGFMTEIPRQGRNLHASQDLESQITITHPGVIEDLIAQSEKRLEKKLMKRILNLSQNSEQNVTDLYQNLQKKLDINKQNAREATKKLQEQMQRI